MRNTFDVTKEDRLSRKLRWVVAIALLLAVVAAGAAVFATRTTFVPEVRDQDPRGAAKLLRSAGLELGTIKLESGAPAGPGSEEVIASDPAAGRWVARGTRVALTTHALVATATVPSVLGLMASDARSALAEVGLRYSGPTDHPAGDHAAASTSIVFGQIPAAGTTASYGSTVTVQAEFPHMKSGDSAGVRSVHGAFYLRYGLRGAGLCNQCHTPATCTGSRCHSGKAFDEVREEGSNLGF
jgi:hypothetical protein